MTLLPNPNSHTENFGYQARSTTPALKPGAGRRPRIVRERAWGVLLLLALYCGYYALALLHGTVPL